MSRSPRDGFVLAAVACAALGLVVVRLYELTTRPSRGQWYFELIVLCGGVVLTFTWAKIGGYGHLDDAITLTAAVVALYEVRAKGPLTAAIAIGIGICAKPWGVTSFRSRWRRDRATSAPRSSRAGWRRSPGCRS